jgi:hypothetical protein
VTGEVQDPNAEWRAVMLHDIPGRTRRARPTEAAVVPPIRVELREVVGRQVGLLSDATYAWWLVSAWVSTFCRFLSHNWVVSHTGGRRYNSVVDDGRPNLGRNSNCIVDAT